MISLVIPTLNAALTLRQTLAAVEGAPVAEIVVADGGSQDGTARLAHQLGAKVVLAPRGRGSQLAAGARAASRDWLLFLHADTALAPTWRQEVARFIQGDGTRAAVFRFQLDDQGPWPRLVERLVERRCRWAGLPYGDQGLLISRPLYESLGGFRPLALMEDVDFVRRLGRRRIVFLATAAMTSAEKYRRRGYLRRSLRNLSCLTLYFAGVSPDRIARIYDAS